MTWQQWEHRSARLATAFTAAGLAPHTKNRALSLQRDRIHRDAVRGVQGATGPRSTSTYRYLDDELHYLLENSDSEALVFHSSLGERVARVMSRCPKVKLWIEVDDGGESIDGTVPYEDMITSHDPAPRIQRSEDDLYMLYTGGTTGMPKGVMYNMGGMAQSFLASSFPVLGLGLPSRPEETAGLVKQACDEGKGIVSIPACPMMHGTGGWVGTMMPHCAGATVVALEKALLRRA